MKWEKFFIWIIILSLASVPGVLLAQQPNEIPIFSKASDTMPKPIILGCQPCSARHGAMIREGNIIWRWEGKRGCWCGWTIQGLTIPQNIDSLNSYSLEIIYKGTYSGNPSPQVKFIDSDGSFTQLKDFSKYSKSGSDGFIRVLIPIKDFAMDFSINEKAIDKIQFDAGWNSSHGTIYIRSIILRRN